MNPTFVLGPCLSKTSSESISFVKNLVSGKFKSGVMDNRNGYVDVRDVAESHLLVLENGRPGERYLCSHGCGAGVGFLDYAGKVREVFPSLAGILPTRNYGKAVLYGVGWLKGYSWWEVYNNVGCQFRYDVSKIGEEVGKTEWIDLRDILRDMITRMKDLGIVDCDLGGK